MLTKLAIVTIVVRDQDEALKFYTETLGLVKKDDIMFGDDGRWLTVAAPQQEGLEIFLGRADSFGMDLMDYVGKAPAWAFSSDDCRGDYERLTARGVKFLSPPEDKPWGIQAVFEDLYGNKFSIVQEPTS